MGYHDYGHHDCCDWNSDCRADGAWRTGNDDEHCGPGPTGHDGALPDFECSVRKGSTSAGSVSLYEDKSRGSECDALDSSGNVVDADSADHCCQGEAYCCDYGSCSSDSDYCGHRFRCGGSPEPGTARLR